jgi:hypothetical protein
MKIHELKTDRVVFNPVLSRQKNFEIRYNDRKFKIGDVLHLRETTYTSAEMKKGSPLEYTGREIVVAVNYILKGPAYGLAKGWVIMAISETRFSVV